MAFIPMVSVADWFDLKNEPAACGENMGGKSAVKGKGSHRQSIVNHHHHLVIPPLTHIQHESSLAGLFLLALDSVKFQGT